MNNTATSRHDPIDITPQTSRDSKPQKGHFLFKMLWLLFILTGVGIAYYAWQMQHETQLQESTQRTSELDQLRQDLSTLKKAYENLVSQQTQTSDSLVEKVTTLEKHLTSAARSSTQSVASPAYLHDILALIALKDIYHKIETGLMFRADVKILEHTPTEVVINLDSLKAASGKRFATLNQLVTGLHAFENYLQAQKPQDPDTNIITQMGNFLKITKATPALGFEENPQILAKAESALELDDVAQAREILKTAFPKTNDEMNEWFEDAASYLEGRELRAELEGWASQLFAATESAEG